jgi:hypothetical protein
VQTGTEYPKVNDWPPRIDFSNLGRHLWNPLE